MDYDVSLLSSEIDVPNELTDRTSPIFDIYPPSIDDLEGDNMGVENTWTDDEFLIPPIPDHPVALPAPSNTVDVTTFEDPTPSSTPLLDEIESIFSPAGPPDIQDDPLFESNLVDVNAEPGVCGLRNLGNTCFINSGLQCLLATAPLAVAVAKAYNTTNQPLTNAFSALTRKVWSGRFSALQPAQFRNAMISMYPQFNDLRQHDCQEFLALLLDALHEQLNTAVSKDMSCQVEPTDFKKGSKNRSPFPERITQSTSKDYGENSRCEKPKMISNNVKQRVRKMILDKSTSTDSSRPTVSNIQQNELKSTDEKQLNHKHRPSVSPLRDDIAGIMDSGPRLTGLDDILKDSKTSNLNVLVQKEAANNEIKFDSDKYPRCEASRRKGEVFNQNTLQFDGNTYGKRNSSLSNMSFSLDFNDGLDLKRVKLSSSSDEDEKNRRMELERQQDSPDLFLEKNERMECEMKEGIEVDVLSQQIDSSLLSPSLPEIKFDHTSEAEAEKHWQKHLANNKSIVVDTFQGQFKSTVTCSVCKFISVTYEPFMYLSVPLPNARRLREYQTISVTFIGESVKNPTEFSIDLNKNDTVSYLRDQILAKVKGLGEVKDSILIAEVFDNHIAKFLEEHLLVHFINDKERRIYAFEVPTLLDNTTVEPIEDIKVEDHTSRSCIICLEDKDTNMKQHENCSFIVCEACIAASCSHYGSDKFLCPLCRLGINPEQDLRPLNPPPDPANRMMNIPIVYRVDLLGDGNNNQKNILRFGHPMVIRVPSHCSSENLRKALSTIIHYKEPYRLLLVDGQGLHCSRCMFHAHCRGCELPEKVWFTQSDSLAVVFSGEVKTLPTNSSTTNCSPSTALTLYDCIQAFSQSETLDANNPWFCPSCKENRCATKTLSVWRYPDYLIVYLKRFVFHNSVSTKLDEKVLFPLNGLSLASGSDYNLYACVCHSGGVSGGHYTTYTQHPYNEQWHFFNDSIVCKQSPLEEDYSNAYILFYKKQGLKPPPIEEALEVIHGES